MINDLYMCLPARDLTRAYFSQILWKKSVSVSVLNEKSDFIRV